VALAPDNSPWYRRFRMLLVIYGLAMLFGAREFLLARAGDIVDQGSADWTRMADVVAAINPAEADTEYLLAMESLQAGDAAGYMEHMETALGKGVKHNNALLAEYAQHLIRMQADFETIDRALNRWKDNHALSFEVLELPLGVGPADQLDRTALRRELDAIDWIYKHELRAPTAEIPAWVVLVQFEPAKTVAIRDLVEALSILAIPPADRRSFAMRCISFESCRLIAR
jgi:hypothetical protein